MFFFWQKATWNCFVFLVSPCRNPSSFMLNTKRFVLFAVCRCHGRLNDQTLPSFSWPKWESMHAANFVSNLEYGDDVCAFWESSSLSVSPRCSVKANSSLNTYNLKVNTLINAKMSTDFLLLKRQVSRRGRGCFPAGFMGTDVLISRIQTFFKPLNLHDVSTHYFQLKVKFDPRLTRNTHQQLTVGDTAHFSPPLKTNITGEKGKGQLWKKWSRNDCFCFLNLFSCAVFIFFSLPIQQRTKHIASLSQTQCKSRILKLELSTTIALWFSGVWGQQRHQAGLSIRHCLFFITLTSVELVKQYNSWS